MLVGGHELKCVTGGGGVEAGKRSGGSLFSDSPNKNIMTVLLKPTWSLISTNVTEMVSSSICVSLSSRHCMCQLYSVSMPL